MSRTPVSGPSGVTVLLGPAVDVVELWAATCVPAAAKRTERLLDTRISMVLSVTPLGFLLCPELRSVDVVETQSLLLHALDGRYF